MDGPTPGDRDTADIIAIMTPSTLFVDMVPLRKTTYDWYAERDGLYELMYQRALPDRADVNNRTMRRPGGRNPNSVKINTKSVEGKERAYQLLALLSDVPMLMDGSFRPLVNDTVNTLERIMNDPKRAFTVTVLSDEEEAEELAITDHDGVHVGAEVTANQPDEVWADETLNVDVGA